MKIVVKRERCVGHARCAAAAPEIFELDSNGYIAFDSKEISAELETQARQGTRACPERALSLVSEDK